MCHVIQKGNSVQLFQWLLSSYRVFIARVPLTSCSRLHPWKYTSGRNGRWYLESHKETRFTSIFEISHKACENNIGTASISLKFVFSQRFGNLTSSRGDGNNETEKSMKSECGTRKTVLFIHHSEYLSIFNHQMKGSASWQNIPELY